MEPAPWEDGATLYTELLEANQLIRRATKFVFNDDPTVTHTGNRVVNQFYVEHRGGKFADDHDRWAIVTMFECLSRHGVWAHEPIPSERTDEWRDEHRFTFDEAIAIATRAEKLMGVGRRIVNLGEVEYFEIQAIFQRAVADVLIGDD